MLNYAYTIVKLATDDEEFVSAMDASHGFCLYHLPLIVEMAEEVLSARMLVDWLQRLFSLQHRNTGIIGESLEEFTWQFDYQTDKTTPERSRDAVARAVRRLAGFDRPEST
jgi:hypothetical protein